MKHEGIMVGLTELCRRCGTYAGYWSCCGGECREVPDSEKWWQRVDNRKPSHLIDSNESRWKNRKVLR